MKWECKVIEDLLPLHLDNICSEETKKVVEEHLMECEECRKLVVDTNKIEIPHIELEEFQTAMIEKKNIRKIRRRWFLSTIAILMLSFSIIGIGFLTYHEVQGEGIAFSNLDDIYRCFKYLHYIEDGRFEEAVEMMDFSNDCWVMEHREASMTYTTYGISEMEDITLEEYQIRKKKVIEKFQKYEMLGIAIDNVRCYQTCRNDKDAKWKVCLSFDEVYPDGSKTKMIVDFNGEYMYVDSWSADLGRVQKLTYIEKALHFPCNDVEIFPSIRNVDVAFELKKGEKALVCNKKDAEIKIDRIVDITYGTDVAFWCDMDMFESSVPGKYAITGWNEGKEVFLTEEDVNIVIMDYEE